MKEFHFDQLLLKYAVCPVDIDPATHSHWSSVKRLCAVYISKKKPKKKPFQPYLAPFFCKRQDIFLLANCQHQLKTGSDYRRFKILTDFEIH